MLLTISGKNMTPLADLVRKVLTGADGSVREWALDWQRSKARLADLAKPEGLNARELPVAAAFVEELAQRTHQAPPTWTSNVGPVPERICLPQRLNQMPQIRDMYAQESPPAFR